MVLKSESKPLTLRKEIAAKICLVALSVVLGVAPAAAQADTFAGKSVQMIIGFGPGGGYDIWARTIARPVAEPTRLVPNATFWAS